MSELKACKVCNTHRHECYGLAVTSLNHLKSKGGEALGFRPNASVSVVLEDDGTIVEDEDYFLCLPANTKFMLLNDKETWTPVLQGTAHLEVDGGDTTDGVESWHSASEHLRQNMANIILMSEAELQSLIDVPCSDLATALGFSEQKTHILQNTLQTVLDRRDEERQSKELLQLYLNAMEKENSQGPLEESAKADETDGVQVENTAGFSSRTLMVLKDKTHPETRLSNGELQMVVRNGAQVLVEVLGWDGQRTAGLVQDCEAELNKRLQQVQALRSLSAQRQSSHITPQPQTVRNKRRK